MDAINGFLSSLESLGETLKSAGEQCKEALVWMPAPALAVIGTAVGLIITLRILGR